MNGSAGRLTATALLEILQPWADVAEPMHQRIARMADTPPESETVWVGCGSGRSVLWWAARHKTRTVGVDPDPAAIDRAEAAARAAGLSRTVTFQIGAPDDLPHETDVFDLTILNALYLSGSDGRTILAQAARVARPKSVIVAVVPSWLGTPTEVDAGAIEALGLRPHLLIEWRNYFREAGIVDLAVDEAAPDGGWIAPGWVGLLVRGWRIAGWKGVRAAMGREIRTLRRLVFRRILALSLVRGIRWPPT